VQVKNIFATQLPKMPREYIARLVRLRALSGSNASLLIARA